MVQMLRQNCPFIGIIVSLRHLNAYAVMTPFPFVLYVVPEARARHTNLEIMKALDRFMREKPSGSLYHYTDAAGLLGIVESRSLWATDYRHLNDRKEYRIGAKLLKDELGKHRLAEKHRRAFERLVAETQKTCYVLSFSEMGDQLSQWRAHCPSGNGYALGFKRSNALFASAKQHSFNLVRCAYDLQEQKKLSVYRFRRRR